MKRTHKSALPHTTKIENGVLIKVYGCVEPPISERQNAFGGHLRARVAVLNTLDLDNGIAYAGYRSNRDR